MKAKGERKQEESESKSRERVEAGAEKGAGDNWGRTGSRENGLTAVQLRRGPPELSIRGTLSPAVYHEGAEQRKEAPGGAHRDVIEQEVRSRALSELRTRRSDDLLHVGEAA